MLVAFLRKKRLLVLVVQAFQLDCLAFQIPLEFDQGILHFPKHVAAILARARRKKTRYLADEVALQRFRPRKLDKALLTLLAAVFYLSSRYAFISL